MSTSFVFFCSYYFYRPLDFQKSTRTGRNFSIPGKSSVLMEQIIPIADFQKTEYFNDFLRRQNIHRQMAVYIRQGDKLAGVLGMHRSLKKSFGMTYLFMGDLIAGSLAAAFERISLKQRIARSNDLLTMIHGHADIGMILLDENRECLFLNIRAGQICTRLSQKYASAQIPGSKNQLIPQIIIDECRQDSFTPLFFRHRKLFISPKETYQMKCQSINRKISGMEQNLLLIMLEDDSNAACIKNSGFKEHFGLTQREIEVLSYICKGFTNLEIAETLFISEGTVKNHLKHIFAKTSATSRTHLVYQTASFHYPV